MRWKRNFAEHIDSEEAKQEQEQDHPNTGPTYESRLLSCTRCGHPNETSWMQLRSKKGFSAIHCRGCGLQQLSGRDKCQCDIVWHHCLSHRIDPAKYLSKKAPKRCKEEQETRRQARAQAEADEGGSRRAKKRKNTPPIVEEGSEAIRNRRGLKGKKVFTRNSTLKPMRTIAPLLKCDPARLERIRLKEKHNHYKATMNKSDDDEQQVSSSSSSSSSSSGSLPPRVELAEEYRSTPSGHAMPITPPPSREPTRSNTSEFRANDGYNEKQRNQRSDFNKQIQRDMELQASNAAARRKTSDEKPNPACKILKTTEFKTARDKADHKKQNAPTDLDKCISRGGNQCAEQAAIFRLLSRGNWREPQAGKQGHRPGGATESE